MTQINFHERMMKKRSLEDEQLNKEKVNAALGSGAAGAGADANRGGRGGRGGGRGGAGRGRGGGRGGYNNNNYSSDFECWGCGGKGHIKRNCPSKPKEGTQGSKSSSSTSNESLAVVEEVIAANVDASIAKKANGSKENKSWSEVAQGKKEVGGAKLNNGAAGASPTPTSAKANVPAEPPVVPANVVAAGSEIQVESKPWLCDTAASCSCTGDKSVLVDLHSIPERRLTMGNKTIVTASLAGKVELRVRNDKGIIVRIIIEEVLYHEAIGSNILSINSLDAQGWQMHIGKDCGRYMQSPRGTIVPLVRANKIYLLQPVKRSEVNHVNVIAAATEGNADRTKRMGKLMELHCQVGHMGVDELLRLIKNGKLVGIDQHISRKELEAGRKEVLECDTCGIMKTKKQTFNNTRGLDHGTKPAEVLHCDMWQSTTSRLNGEPNEKQTTYYMVFRDPYTQHGWRAATTSKDRLTDLVIEMIKLSERQLDGKVKRIYSDGGSEVVNEAMKKFCKSVGIVHQLSPPRTPELDGIAENAVFNHKTATFTMMTYSGLPDQFTTYAADHAMYLWNRVHVSKVTGVTPYEYIRGKAPSMKYWGVFGCDTLVHIDKRLRKTGDPHAERGIYLGHNVNYNCANIYILRTKKVIQSRHIRFRLNKFNYAHAFKLGQHAVDRILDGYDVELEEMKDDNKEWDQDTDHELEVDDLEWKKKKAAAKEDDEQPE
ncbi:MAG TPA: hypothetical protein VHA52_07615, partial [Candidatus Babeliaceae bacterium]|nr:hypothetical protein [Candidatus Babeliaceae bacterium]